MRPSGGPAKKFSFSLNKNKAVNQDAQAGVAKRDHQAASKPHVEAKAANGQSWPPSGLARVLGFEDAAAMSEKPKAQTLLSISEGQLEVEGGVAQAPPRVIPCRNPLPLSDYRIRITDEGKPRWVEREPQATTSTTPLESTGVQSQAPVWGLQVKRVMPEAQRNEQQPVRATSTNSPSSKPETLSRFFPGEAPDVGATKVKTESPSSTRVTDEEVAASLLAEARGERNSDRVVPLLARNSALADIRQKYWREVAASRGQQQQAGEPDKLLLQRELALLPDAPAPSSAAYEAMPVEEFGAAMLRGMGLKSIPSAAAPVKRKAYTRAGLGTGTTRGRCFTA
ncbi:hypothetical protein Efla_003101 [Eimeria flavescens]